MRGEVKCGSFLLFSYLFVDFVGIASTRSPSPHYINKQTIGGILLACPFSLLLLPSNLGGKQISCFSFFFQVLTLESLAWSSFVLTGDFNRIIPFFLVLWFVFRSSFWCYQIPPVKALFDFSVIVNRDLYCNKLESITRLWPTFWKKGIDGWKYCVLDFKMLVLYSESFFGSRGN